MRGGGERERRLQSIANEGAVIDWKAIAQPCYFYFNWCTAQSRQCSKLFLQSSALGPGGAHSPGGGGGVPIPTRGHTLWYPIYICTLRCTVQI